MLSLLFVFELFPYKS